MSMRSHNDQVALEERDREELLEKVKASLSPDHRHFLRIAILWGGKLIATDDPRDPLPESVADPVTGELTIMGRDIRSDLLGTERG